MFDFVKDETLIICPLDYKNNILDYLTKNKLIINLKFMTINEYKKNLLFDYDYHAIDYLVDKYRLKVPNAKELIENLYYVSDKKYNNEKLDYLVSIKKELDSNNLLIYNPLFKKYLNWNTVIYGYGKLDKFYNNMFSKATIIPYKLIDKEYNIYHFDDVNSELEFVFNTIVDLIKKGISINDIYLMNVTSEYYSYLKRFSKFYHIPISDINNDSIMGTTIVKDFYQMIVDQKDREEIFNKLDNESNLYGVLVNILNKYNDTNLYDVKELIYDDLLNTKLPSIKYNNVLNFVDLFNYIDDSKYVFLIGFNNGTIPTIYNDIDYITDNIKGLVNMSNSNELNMLSKNNTLAYLSNIKNLYISYKDQSPFASFYPSTLLEDMKIKEVKYESNYDYSEDYNKVRYIDKIDNFIKYGLFSEDINRLYSSYGKLNYLSYDNSYNKINKESLIEYLDNKLTLSYSSIDSYYKCGFKYYLTNILDIDLYDETFSTRIGSLFHDVLSHKNDDDFNMDECYKGFVSKYEFSNKEKFFIDKLKPDLEFILKVLNEYQLLTGLNKEMFEEKIQILIKDSPLVYFKGFVDKIMYDAYNDKTLVSIIDYKTGNIDINLSKLPLGLSMQLPVYLYLIEKSKLFDNPVVVGFYLQHILDNEIKRDDKKSYLELKKDNLKLCGYSLNNKEYLSIFDSSYENSEMIKGLKLKKDGEFTSNSKILSSDEFKNIVNIVDDNIKKGTDLILNAEFPINPKIVNDVNVSCEFCKYKDICYLSEKNKEYIKLEGETNVDEGTE